MNVLGIETSCDETSAAVVADGCLVRSNVIDSQIDLHRQYGGVVPEVASRCHVENIMPVIQRALADANCTLRDIDAIATTYGPGLATSLIVGVSTARGLATSLGKPLILVNHLEAHIYSPFLADGAPSVEAICPFVALVVSGGHTMLIRVRGVGEYELLGETADDAAGEAFDKGAKILGLGFPGGPAIDKASQGGNPSAWSFPRGITRRAGEGGEDGSIVNFSYSGLKTALLYHVRANPVTQGTTALADLAASYQEAIVDSIIENVARVIRRGQVLAVGGGVSLNRRLRSRLQEWTVRAGVTLMLAPPQFCADNAAMVAGLAAHKGGGLQGDAILGLDVEPGLRLRGAREE